MKYVYATVARVDQVPPLPPKQKLMNNSNNRAVEQEPIYAPVPSQPRKASAISKQRQSVETQTEPYVNRRQNHVSSVHIAGDTNNTSSLLPRGRVVNRKDVSTATAVLRNNNNNLNKEEEVNFADATLRKEISWSVSQLRALFGGSVVNTPPPYRHPPSMSESDSSSCSNGEESYV
jgi:hypothetical protein